MCRRVAPILLLLACAAPLAGCDRLRPGAGGSGTTGGGIGFGYKKENADELAAALGELTGELAAKVEASADTRAGVAEAQRLLDSRKGAMAARIDAFRKGAAGRDPAARARWLEAEVDNTQRVRALQLKHLDASLRDPELKAGLERLAADYDSMFRDRPGPSPLE